jgi:hypothetical protein
MHACIIIISCSHFGSTMFLVNAWAAAGAAPDPSLPPPPPVPPLAAGGARARGRGLGRGRHGVAAVARGRGAPVVGDDPADDHDDAAEGRGRGRGRGHPLGAPLSRQHRLTIRCSQLRRRPQSPRGVSFAQTCAHAAFGQRPDSFDKSQRSTTVWTSYGGVTLPTVVSTQNKSKRDTDRGVASHVVAQAQGVHRFVHTAPQNSILRLFTNVFDDADMWVQKPMGSDAVLDRRLARRLAQGELTFQEKLQEKMARRCKNIHMPVMNICEYVMNIIEQETDHGSVCTARVAEVFSGTAAMPGGNFATLWRTWKRGSIFNGTGVAGTHVDPERAVSFDKDDTLLFWCKDSLSANLNMVGAMEDLIDAKIGTDQEFSMYSVNCMSHQLVLTLRPATEAFPGLTSFLSKYGHLWESGRFSSKVTSKHKEFAGKAVFRDVWHLPPRAAEWRARNQQLLEAARPALDISLEEEAFLLDFDNSDWGDVVLVHWHLEGVCRCGGPECAKSNWERVMRVMHGGGCPKCLIARWKDVQRSNCYVYRTANHHDLPARTMHLLYTSAKVREAEAELVGAAQRGDINYGAAQTVKAGTCLTWMDANKGATTCHRSILLNKPYQDVLDRTFSAQTHLTQLLDAARAVPATLREDQTWPLMEKEMEECRSRNVKFLDGTYAIKAAAVSSEYLSDLDGGPWSAVAWTRPEKFEFCQHITTTICSGWYRLEFRVMEDPKNTLLAACGRKEHLHANFETTLEEFREKRGRCSACVPRAFAGIWLDKLLRNRVAAGKKLFGAVPFLPIASIIAEQLHVRGQDIYKKGRRGKTLRPETLSRRVYRKNVCISAAHAVYRVRRSCLPGKHAMADFSKYLLRGALLKRVRRRARHAPRALGRTNKSCGWFKYRRTNWPAGVKPCCPEGRTAQRTLRTQWLASTQEQQELYGLEARTEDLALATIADTHKLGDDAFKRGTPGVCGRSSKQRAAKIAFGTALDAMRDSDVYRSGTQLSCFGMAIDPSKVLCDHTDSDISQLLEKSFSYNHVVADNPAKNPSARLPCVLRHGGLCATDDLLASCASLCKNVYHRCLEHGLKHSATFPMSFSIDGAPEHLVWHGWGFGKGDMIVVMPLRMFAAVGRVTYAMKYDEQQDGTHIAVRNSLARWFRNF